VHAFTSPPARCRERAIPRRIAFINEKGGSAKTTLAANLGAYLALHRRQRVLAVDLDPQGQLGKVLGVEVHAVERSALDLLLGTPGREACPGQPEASESTSRTDPTLPRVPTRIDALDLVIANKSLAVYPSWEIRGGDPTAGLRRALSREDWTGAYDYILMDAPPSFGPLTLNVLRATDEVVVPVPLTYLALDGCAELMRTVEAVRTRFGNPELRVSMVVPMFYRPTRLAREVLDQLRERFPKEIARTIVGYHVKIDEAQAQGVSIFEYAPRDPGAREMALLAEELELRRPAESTAKWGGVG